MWYFSTLGFWMLVLVFVNFGFGGKGGSGSNLVSQGYFISQKPESKLGTAKIGGEEGEVDQACLVSNRFRTGFQGFPCPAAATYVC